MLSRMASTNVTPPGCDAGAMASARRSARAPIRVRCMVFLAPSWALLGRVLSAADAPAPQRSGQRGVGHRADPGEAPGELGVCENRTRCRRPVEDVGIGDDIFEGIVCRD